VDLDDVAVNDARPAGHVGGSGAGAGDGMIRAEGEAHPQPPLTNRMSVCRHADQSH
jgi:hypothetical protein